MEPLSYDVPKCKTALASRCSDGFTMEAVSEQARRRISLCYYLPWFRYFQMLPAVISYVLIPLGC